MLVHQCINKMFDLKYDLLNIEINFNNLNELLLINLLMGNSEIILITQFSSWVGHKW